MKEQIKKVLICGLGGVGSVCATTIFRNKKIELKILVDEKRIERYKKEKTFFNDIPYEFEYILPSKKNFSPDLIIIATKNDGLEEAIKNIKNFVSKETIIISLLNGIHSEEEIAKVYGWKNIIYSFYIGNSCIREGRKITMRGNYKIVIGTDKEYNKTALEKISNFFYEIGIKYEISNNILDDYWQKFLINVGVNQTCAYTRKELKEIRENKEQTNLLKNLMKEARQIAEKKGIENHDKIYKNAEKFLLKEFENAHPSMLQDVENKRQTEIDIFAGKIIELGKKYNINTPENEKVYSWIKKHELN